MFSVIFRLRLLLAAEIWVVRAGPLMGNVLWRSALLPLLGSGLVLRLQVGIIGTWGLVRNVLIFRRIGRFWTLLLHGKLRGATRQARG